MYKRQFRYYTYEDGPDQFFAIYAGDQLAEAGQLENFDALASEEGPYYKADTLEELGRKCGFDAALFSKSLSEYNSFCETGIDVFELAETAATHVNADTLAGTAGSGRKPIVNGPFYATRVTMVGFDIIGGVKTGSNGEVLRADGSAIPGLYGVGFFSSRDYMGSGASHYYCLMLCVSSGMVTADAVTAAIQ